MEEPPPTSRTRSWPLVPAVVARTRAVAVYSTPAAPIVTVFVASFRATVLPALVARISAAGLPEIEVVESVAVEALTFQPVLALEKSGFLTRFAGAAKAGVVGSTAAVRPAASSATVKRRAVLRERGISALSGRNVAYTPRVSLSCEKS